MKLLKELYEIHSPSKGEKKMRKFIRKWIGNNVEGAEMVTDNRGNLLVVKGESETYPCIVAHMDQVQDKHEKDFKCYVVGDNLFGFSESAMAMRGLGADDKNGIWVALKCLKEYDVMKCAFFVGEEIGCVGSEAVDMGWFSDCRWVVQCDRRDNDDLITTAGGTELCSSEFMEALNPLQFGYKETSGLMTDVMTLKERGLGVSCVNMSCGYYRPHTDGEYTNVKDLQNCLAFVRWIVENVTDVYPHEYEPPKWQRFGEYGRWYDNEFYGGAVLSDEELAEYITYYLSQYPAMSDDEVWQEVQWDTYRSEREVRAMISAARAELALQEMQIENEDMPDFYEY